MSRSIPRSIEGDWTGKYADNKTFKISVSNVTGFRAKVQYQSGGTSKYQDVLIKDNAFRVGDTKFTLTKIGTAEVKNVVTDPGKRADAARHGLRQAELNQLTIRPISARLRPCGRWRAGAVGASLVRSRAWK